jgi:hypothetical protein
VKVTFPIVTSSISKRDEYLVKLQDIVDSDFQELFFIAPYVDGMLIENLLKRFLYNQKRLILISRFGDLFPEQKTKVRKAVVALKAYARKDHTIAERVTWYVTPNLHAKLVIKDWHSILFGSQNFTYSALKGNFELGALLEDIEEVRKPLEEFVGEIIKSSSKKLFP